MAGHETKGSFELSQGDRPIVKRLVLKRSGLGQGKLGVKDIKRCFGSRLLSLFGDIQSFLGLFNILLLGNQHFI